MFGSLGWPELILILAVVLLVFGVGRISKVGSELGKGINAFREGIREGKDETAPEGEAAQEPGPQESLDA